MAALGALVIALLAACLALLHGHVLRYPFISDDFFFLYEARTRGLAHLVTGSGTQHNYYRPLGREIYFATLVRLADDNPLIFHVASFSLLVLLVALVFELGRRLSGPRAGALAATAYALFYPHRVLLAWASCAQDLLAACYGVGAAIAFQSNRTGLATAAFFLGLLCKESIAPLPLVLAAWTAATASPGARMRSVFRRVGPMLAAMVVWGAIVVAVRLHADVWNAAGTKFRWADVVLSPRALWEGFRGTALAVFYADQPFTRLGDALRSTPLPWLAAIAGAAATVAAFALPAAAPGTAPAGGQAPPRSAPGALVSGASWFAVASLPLALVGHHYSAYYVTFAAVGFALVVGALLARVPVWLAAVLVVGAVWLDAGANATRTFRSYEDVLGVSDFTAARMDFVAGYLRALERALRADPPAPGTRVTISHAPRYVAFATGANRALWVWFRDTTLTLEYLTSYQRGDGRPRMFLRYVERAQRFDPVSPAFIDAVVEGEEALAAGDAARAKPSLERALSLAGTAGYDDERVELLVELGAACRRLNDAGGARRAWMTALAAEPGHVTALLNLTALAGSEGRFDEARGWVTRALGASPDHPEALLLLARVERARGAFGAAHEAWLKLSRTHAAFADSLAGRGESY